jgi:DNA-directed RNA polymerase specialized sigma24 family protein
LDEYLELFFRKNIFAYIKSQCPHFNPQDLKEVYQDTMRRMVKKASQPNFDPARPMRLVQDIARKACIDAKRKKKLPVIGDARDIADKVGDGIKGTKAAMEWSLILKKDMPKVRRAIAEASNELPMKQKNAATAMMHVFAEVHDPAIRAPRNGQRITSYPSP